VGIARSLRILGVHFHIAPRMLRLKGCSSKIVGVQRGIVSWCSMANAFAKVLLNHI